MGRPALTDGEKRAKGTLDKRYTEEARAERVSATVVAFPTLQKIPKCPFPLDNEGTKIYDSLTRSLFEQGYLTTLTHLEISSLAASVTSMRTKMASGLNVPVGSFTSILERIDKLQRANVDRAFHGQRSPDQRNKFASSGFAVRAKR